MKKLAAALFILSLALLTGPIQAKEWKEVRIAIEGAYPPFSTVDKNGNLQGFDVDIAKALCEAMSSTHFIRMAAFSMLYGFFQYYNNGCNGKWLQPILQAFQTDQYHLFHP